MGNYCSNAELIARFGSTEEAAFATDSTDPATPTATVLTEAIGAAEGLMNSYFAHQWITPVVVTDAEIAELVKGCALDLAHGNVHRRKPNAPDEVKERRAEWIEWLKMAADGKVHMPGATPVTTPSRDPLAQWSDATRTQPDDSGRVFTRESMASL